LPEKGRTKGSHRGWWQRGGKKKKRKRHAGHRKTGVSLGAKNIRICLYMQTVIMGRESRKRRNARRAMMQK